MYSYRDTHFVCFDVLVVRAVTCRLVIQPCVWRRRTQLCAVPMPTVSVSPVQNMRISFQIFSPNISVSAESYFNDAITVFKGCYGPGHEVTIGAQDELAHLQIRSDRQEVRNFQFWYCVPFRTECIFNSYRNTVLIMAKIISNWLP